MWAEHSLAADGKPLNPLNKGQKPLIATTKRLNPFSGLVFLFWPNIILNEFRTASFTEKFSVLFNPIDFQLIKW